MSLLFQDEWQATLEFPQAKGINWGGVPFVLTPPGKHAQYMALIKYIYCATDADAEHSALSCDICDCRQIGKA